eukprot:CAMPEP_0197658450 /NCGR_PEP_ID=MMETSP1338-20131121/45247_1 /TAXON_ID=43686 ORGANISM="Pelagodinium beii, Strain RCC1491" /NCGR_SAMPLE_ID=MMETSP1338 /ASSEMBLY_ACC=CAM_ASM_000754 /LENGTH=225 /DNA_ID=CAMNT_0043235045 /DNA_START=250 /DNA_END=927 /DNA_ORIENTATION=+
MVRFSVIAWMFGNGLWMTSEFLFESATRNGGTFPWFHGLLWVIGSAETDAGVDSAILWAVRGLLVLSILLHVTAQGYVRSSRFATQQMMSVMDDEAWIGAWVLKDLFWTLSLLVPGLAAAAMTLGLMLRSMSLKGHRWNVDDGSELLWLFGNIVWFVGELALQDGSHWPRILACGILSFAAFLQASELLKEHLQGGRQGEHSEESYPLLSDIYLKEKDLEAIKES